jgi:hypothetical protein
MPSPPPTLDLDLSASSTVPLVDIVLGVLECDDDEEAREEGEEEGG